MENITCKNCLYRRKIYKNYYCGQPKNSGNGAFFAVVADDDFYCKRAKLTPPYNSIFESYINFLKNLYLK